MTRKVVITCDGCGRTIEDGAYLLVQITDYTDMTARDILRSFEFHSDHCLAGWAARRMDMAIVPKEAVA